MWRETIVLGTDLGAKGGLSVVVLSPSGWSIGVSLLDPVRTISADSLGVQVGFADRVRNFMDGPRNWVPYRDSAILTQPPTLYGPQLTTWSPENLASGVYLLRLETRTKTDTIRVGLLK